MDTFEADVKNSKIDTLEADGRSIIFLLLSAY